MEGGVANLQGFLDKKCDTVAEFSYVIRFSYSLVNLYDDLNIPGNNTGSPLIIRKDDSIQAFIKKFGNNFDEDDNIFFPKIVERIQINIMVQSSLIDVTKCVEVRHNQASSIFIEKKYFLGTISECQNVTTPPVDRISLR